MKVGFAALALLLFFPLRAEPVTKPGVTVELVCDQTAVVPGRPLALGFVIRHQPTYHTYWRQPGLVGLAPTLEWTLPAGFAAGTTLWPEPQRTHMARYGVWGFERDVCLVTPIEVPPTLDPQTTPTITFSVKAVWMACGRTCHPSAADLTITLPVQAPPALASAAARWFDTTRREQALVSTAWKVTAAGRADGGFSVVITPPSGQRVPDDAYFYSYGRLVDSNVPQTRHAQADGAVRLDLALVETPDPPPAELTGELWSSHGWEMGNEKRLLAVRAPLPTTAGAERTNGR